MNVEMEYRGDYNGRDRKSQEEKMNGMSVGKWKKRQKNRRNNTMPSRNNRGERYSEEREKKGEGGII